MNDTGFVYVLINPSMEGLIKVGKTTRDPKERANELSKATGVPTPFIVAYHLAVHDCSKAEAFVHTYLEGKGYRVSSNREFFDAPLNIAIDAILEYKNIDVTDQSNGYSDYDDCDETYSREPWEDVEDLAHDYWLGNGNTLEDHKEALVLFKKACKLGSPRACQQVGFMYKIGQGCTANVEKALEYFKEGVKRGNFECYGDLMDIYFDNNQIDNAFKCWDMYMENSIYVDPYKCARYILAMYKLNMPVRYREKLIDLKDQIYIAQSEKIRELEERENRVGYFTGCTELRSDANNTFQYMQYIFDISPDEQVMNGKDYINKIFTDNAKVASDKSNTMLIVCLIISFIFSFVMFSSLFGKIVGGIVITCVLIKVVIEVMTAFPFIF